MREKLALSTFFTCKSVKTETYSMSQNEKISITVAVVERMTKQPGTTFSE